MMALEETSVMIETYTIGQLYDRLRIAERQWRDGDIDYASYLSVASDYQRALIIEARHKQGEY